MELVDNDPKDITLTYCRSLDERMSKSATPLEPTSINRDSFSRETSLTSDGSDAFIREIIWNMLSISVHLEDVARHWSRFLNISVPQWLILMAIDYLDRGEGVSIRDVSSKLHVNSTFITTQSKMLEKDGYIERRPSSQDGRVVLLSLTGKARRSIAELSVRRQEINDFVFSGLGAAELERLADQISLIRNRLDKATRILQAER